MQAGGRGALGFESVYSYDTSRNVTTHTRYHQGFPLIGMPISTSQYIGRRSDDESTHIPLSLASNSYKSIPLNGGANHFVAMTGSDERAYTLNDGATASEFYRRTVTTQEYKVIGEDDSHANLSAMTVCHTDQAEGDSPQCVQQVHTEHEFTVDYGVDGQQHWWLGRVTDTTVSHTRPGMDVITRQSEFAYYPEDTPWAGMLKADIQLAPAGVPTSQGRLTTRHCYDDYGNTVSTLRYGGGVSLALSDSQCVSPEAVAKLTIADHIYPTPLKIPASERSQRFQY